MKQTSSQNGFTLLEMLLAVGITALMMVMISKVSSEFMQQRAAQSAGQQLSRMSDLLEDVMHRMSPTLGGWAAQILSTETMAYDPNNNSYYGPAALNVLQINNFDIKSNAFRIANSNVNVIYSRSLASGGAGAGALYNRVIVILERPYPLTQAIKMARAIGARGGIIRQDHPTDIISAFGNWTYPMSSELQTAVSTVAASALQTGEAYVVSYSALAQSDIRGPYLNIYGDDNGNVMHTDLIMNGKSIAGAQNIDVGVLSATKGARFDELDVNGKANFQGGVDAGDRVTVKGDLTVSDGDMSVAGGDLNVPGGNVNAKGLRADTLETEDLTTKDLSTENLTVEGGNTLITSNVTVSGGATMDITGPLKASVVDAGQITSDTMKTKDMVVRNAADFQGTTTINNTANINRLVINGCMNLSGQTYGACN